MTLFPYPDFFKKWECFIFLNNNLENRKEYKIELIPSSVSKKVLKFGDFVLFLEIFSNDGGVVLFLLGKYLD